MAIEDLKLALDRSARTEGFLFGREAEALFRLASIGLPELQGGGAVIEIGSFCGKSTVALASAARLRKDIVVCIDPLKGSPEHAELLKGNGTRQQFENNLKDFIDEGIVRLICLPSDDAISELQHIIGHRKIHPLIQG